MQVFRVAHSTAKKYGQDYHAGPYSTLTEPELPPGAGEDLVFPMSIEHSGDGSHPAPSQCPLLEGISPWEVCGLVSREALGTWFDGWHDVLAQFGYQAHVYEISDPFVRVGTHGQCVFIISLASLVRVEKVTQ